LNIDELLEHLTPKDARPTAGALVPPTGQTPQDAMRLLLERREAELREEYARLHAGGSDHYGQEAWRGAMRRAGRVQ
jgi:hypothetical protein